MHQMLDYVKKVLDKYGRPIVVPTELADMIAEVNTALDTLQSAGYTDPAPTEDVPLAVPAVLFDYWNAVATAREAYREKVEYYFSGKTTELSAQEVSGMITRWLGEVELGMARAIRVGSHGFEDNG